VHQPITFHNFEVSTVYVATYSHCSLLTLTVSTLYSCYIWTKSDFNRHL